MSIFKLSQASQNFIQQAATAGKATSLSFSIAVARSLYVHTKQATGPEVESMLSQLNELVVLDRETVKSLVASFGKWHTTLFLNPTVILSTPELAVGNFFEFNRHFSPVTIEAIRTDGLFIAQTANQLISVFEELCAE